MVGLRIIFMGWVSVVTLTDSVLCEWWKFELNFCVAFLPSKFFPLAFHGWILFMQKEPYTIARAVHRSGCSKWRDSMKPTQILSNLCKREYLPRPVYKDGACEIGPKKFVPKKHLNDDRGL